MEKNIDDVKFRKFVLSLKNSGFTIEEIIDLSQASERLVKDIVRTFSILDVNTELNHGFYSELELESINSGKNIKTIVKETNRSYFTIKDKIGQDRKTKRKQDKRKDSIGGYCQPYTENEYGFIKISYENGVPTSEIARILNRTERSIRSFCMRNNISRKKQKGDFIYGEKHLR